MEIKFTNLLTLGIEKLEIESKQTGRQSSERLCVRLGTSRNTITGSKYVFFVWEGISSGVV